jgi:RHS repeat-associated protein
MDHVRLVPNMARPPKEPMEKMKNCHFSRTAPFTENRLVGMTSLTNTSGTSNSWFQLKFAYDYQGRRIQKVVFTNSPSTNYVGEYTNTYAYDGWNCIGILNSSLSLVNSFLWGSDLSGSVQGAGGVGGLVEMACYGASTTNCFAAFDGNGNVSALVNAANGATVANYDYGPFGEVIRATGPMAKLNPFRFSTKYDDDESDLLYYGYRYYNPSTGRWLSKDPLEEDGGEGLYVWAANEPGTHIDLYGLQCQQVSGQFQLPFNEVTIPLGLYAEADASLNVSVNFEGTSCDCCGKGHTQRSKGKISVSGNAEVGITLGKRVNKTFGGINFMGFAGIRIAGTGGIQGSGEYVSYCDNTSSAEFTAGLKTGVNGQGGIMLSFAYPRGWPRRLTGPPWGERTGIGLVIQAEGTVTTTLNVACEDATCKVYANEQADASADIKGSLGPLSLSWNLGSVSGSWTQSNPVAQFANPFN